MQRYLMSNRMLAPLGTALNTLGWTCQVPEVATLSLDPAAAHGHGQNCVDRPSRPSQQRDAEIQFVCVCGSLALQQKRAG